MTGPDEERDEVVVGVSNVVLCIVYGKHGDFHTQGVHGSLWKRATYANISTFCE